MSQLFKGIIAEWNTAPAFKKLAIIADVASLFGFSIATLLGALVVETIRPGKVDWGGATLFAAGIAFFFAAALAVHGFLSWAVRVWDRGVMRWVGRLLLLGYWLLLIAGALEILPEAFASLVLKSA